MATAPKSGGTAASALPAAGGTSESTISNWAGPYITNMLGKAQAIANEPYQVYQGPMTAGESGLQSKVFQGLGNLSFPGNFGQSFASPMGGVRGGAMGVTGGSPAPDYGAMVQRPEFMGGGNYANSGTPDYGNLSMEEVIAQSGSGPLGGNGVALATGQGRDPTSAELSNMQKEYFAAKARGEPVASEPPGMDGRLGGIAGLQPPQPSQQPSSIAQSYMNPYLQSVLNPQLDELQRRAQINNLSGMGALTKSGAFGGGRQAIMESEANRNLLQEQNKTVGQGYANAYDKAMGQFNTEQGQSKDLINMMANLGGVQRGIEQEGITADYNEFLTQRDDPMKKTQYLQSMLQGLPYQTVTNTPLGMSGLGQLAELGGSMDSLEATLKKLGLT